MHNNKNQPSHHQSTHHQHSLDKDAWKPLPEAPQPLYSDFSIELTPSTLIQFIQQYGLKVSEISGHYVVNKESLDAITQSENGTSTRLIHTLSNWPQQLNWAQFFEHITTLLAAWLNDYMAGAQLDFALMLTKNIALEKADSSTSETCTLKFQQLVIHLIARVTNQFDQYKFEYWQHFNIETGLPNQQLLLSMLDTLLSDSQQTSEQEAHAEYADNPFMDHSDAQRAGIIVINLNINFDEAFKLNTAASILEQAAIQTIKRQLNHEAILFHVNAHEFAILIKNLTFSTQLNLIISQLSYAFETALSLENITLILTPYFGGASTFNPETNAVSLYEHARLALHHAMVKNTQMQIYDETLSVRFVDNHLLEEAIIEALQQNELATFLQPIVSIKEEVCKTAEVLLRWPTQQWPYVPPPMLIETIYKKGFGKVFIRWLINNACQRCAELLFTHQRSILLTVNVGVHDLLDADLPELIAQAIELWEIPAQNIVFEITESDLLADESQVSLVIDKIKLLGCQIALDDFGTGYSSMARLRNMPVDFVKIDQSFVRNILSSKQDLEIVQSVIKLAHSLGKQVVAEGVEDIGSVNLLKSLQCEKIQGYYYSKPLSFDAFVQWLDAFETAQHTSAQATLLSR
jgi:EAL domain-containing protein (putative c-di-GMP-specific phosphodiesterase class I)/GGDEF domain-containing protein